jgi:hypothetical protein
MKHELKKHALLLAQALISPDDVRSRYAATSPDECEMPPENAEVQASLAVSDLLDQALVGMDVRWEAPATLAAAAQFAADKHGDDAGEQYEYWRKETPSEDYSAEDIEHNREYFEAHSLAAQRLSNAIAEALKRYAADISHAESL